MSTILTSADDELPKNVLRPNFRQRLDKGEELEQEVAQELKDRGWDVHRYGMGTWSEDMRDILGQTRSHLRYAPDLYATRSRKDLVFIDCKNTLHRSDGSYYRINRDCLAAGRNFGPRYDVPLYYVFDDLGVLTPHQIMEFLKIPHLTNGVGTWIAVPRHLPVTFNEIFGPRKWQPIQKAA